jgi:hypothetical protein
MTTERTYFSGPMVSLDTLSGARHFIEKNWGDYGYRVGIHSAGNGSAIFAVSHSDGSQFFIFVDRWGNAGRYAPGCICGVPEPVVFTPACRADHFEPFPHAS